MLRGRELGREGRRPLSLPASFALVLPSALEPFFHQCPTQSVPCRAPPPRICWWSVSILSISFHFSCSGCTRINNYRPLSPHRSLSLPSPDLFSNHFCLPLNASSSFSTPSCHLSIITLLGDRKQSPRAALQMKMKRAGRQETKMVGQRREEEQEKGTGGHSNQYLCWEGAIFHAVLLLFYYFSGFLVFRSRSGREPAAVTVSVLILLPPLAALAILPPLAKPLQQEFGEKTDPGPALLAFSSWSYLMVIKMSAQGLATHQHKENTWSRRWHSRQHNTFQSHSGTK